MLLVVTHQLCQLLDGLLLITQEVDANPAREAPCLSDDSNCVFVLTLRAWVVPVRHPCRDRGRRSPCLLVGRFLGQAWTDARPHVPGLKHSGHTQLRNGRWVISCKSNLRCETVGGTCFARVSRCASPSSSATGFGNSSNCKPPSCVPRSLALQPASAPDGLNRRVCVIAQACGGSPTSTRTTPKPNQLTVLWPS